jgi:AraC family transcriptional activator of pobA
MNSTSNTPKLDIMMLTHNERTINYKDWLFLGDSLSMKPGTLTWVEATKYPCIVDFTICMFCIKGSIRLKMNLMEYHISDNDIFFALNGSIVKFISGSNDCQMAVIAVCDDRFVTEVGKRSKKSATDFITSHAVIHVDTLAMSNAISIYKLLHSLLSDDSFYQKHFAIDSCLRLLSCYCGNLVSKNMDDNIHAKSKQQLLFENFITLVHDNCIRERGLQFYADKLQITPKYLSHIIHQVSDRFASDLIRDFVILAAKALLKGCPLSVAQVSEKMNFPNPAFFNKYFKTATGITPHKYQLS